MHPEVILDKPGSCPICGMELVPRHTPGTETAIDSSLKHLLKPVNEQVVSNISVIKPQGGTKIFSLQVQGIITYDTREQTSISSRVSGRIERLLIKYNYQPIKKGQLIMEIYSPDLAAVHTERRGTEEQSDAAFCQGIAFDRYPAGHPAVPYGS